MPKEEMARVAPPILMFTPDKWGEVDRFTQLHSGTYKLKPREVRVLSGVRAHFHKGLIFKNIANEMRPNLKIDRVELKKQGFTAAEHSKNLSACVEAAVLELYSSVDCTAKVLRSIYGPTTRGFKDSTRSLFKACEKIKGLPEEIVVEIRNADWYSPLLHLRDELTHCDAGKCHFNEDTGLVYYMHTGISKGEDPLIIEDVFSWIEKYFDDVNKFLARIFRFLSSNLSDNPVELMCGMTDGRILLRAVNPSETLTFDNGHCLSHQWFDLPENPSCPFSAQCGAYVRTTST